MDLQALEKTNAAPASSAADDIAFVVDPTVQPDGPARTHEMLRANGSTAQYTFSFQTPLEVPLPHALRFLESGFLVFADEDMRKPLKRTRGAKEGHDGHAVQTLNDDEIIAHLEELTQAALYKRAAALPGGDAYKPNERKDKLIAFVTEYNARNAKVRNRVEADDLIEGGLTTSEIEKANEAAL